MIALAEITKKTVRRSCIAGSEGVASRIRLVVALTGVEFELDVVV
jgi:hypothetical protein